MTLRELKTTNLNRICEKKHIKAAELGKLLNAKVQHGSQLLKGKSPLGDRTISKLAAIWGIDELEFIRREDLKNSDFMCGWPEDAIDYCKKLKNILDGGEEKHITAIKEMIDVYSGKAEKTPKKGLLKPTGT